MASNKMSTPQNNNMQFSQPNNNNLTTQSSNPSQDFEKKAIQTFNQFRKTNQFIDLNVTVEDEVFKCHKIIVVRNSEFFKNLLNDQPNETGTTGQKSSDSEPNTVNIRLIDYFNIKKDTFKILLDYFYEGKESLLINLTILNVSDVMMAAINLKSAEAITLSSRFFQDNQVLIQQVSKLTAQRNDQTQTQQSAQNSNMQNNLTNLLTSILALKQNQTNGTSSSRGSPPKTESLNISDSGKLS